MKSDPTLKKWYRRINKKFFENQLPNNVCVRWAEGFEEDDANWEDKYFGSADKVDNDAHSYEIVLSRVKNEAASIRMLTLAHEMCHIATDCKDDHGPVFEEWRQYISDRGFFKKGAVRKGLTIF